MPLTTDIIKHFLSHSKNGFFWAPFQGGSRWSCPKKFREKKLRLQLNNFTQKLDFDVLWFRRRPYENYEEKKEINLITAKSGLVGIKGYLETYNHMKYFLPYLRKPFLTETAFYAKLPGRFSGSKTEVTRPIASKFHTNIQLINLKLLSKFHVAKPNRSRVISNSLTFRTR